MRTTVTLTPQAHALIRQAMDERGVSFTEVINAVVVDSLAPKSEKRVFRTRTHDMGREKISLIHANRLAADLEDEEILRKMGMRR